MESLKIVSLETENVKKIKAVRINPDGSLVIIGGNNGQGKSSVLDSIMYALAGGASIPNKPIRDGEDKAKITLDLGDYIVTRKITEKGSTLTIKNKEGVNYSSPQKMLDDMVGSLSFDPLDFSRMRPREQAETLMGFSDFDFKANEEKYQEVYDVRTETNRQLKALQIMVDEYVVHEGLPEKPLDYAELYRRIDESKAHNAKLDDLKKRHQETQDDQANVSRDLKLLENSVAEHLAEIEISKKVIQAYKEDNAKSETMEVNLKKSIDEFVSILVDPLIEKHHQATAINQKISDNKAHQENVDKLRKGEKIASELTSTLKVNQQEKTDAIAKANIPVEGLTFDRDGIAINGIPFVQCSSAEQLKASVAVGFAMNPKIKVVLLREGSLLDQNSLALVAKMAEDAGGQVWCEMVGKGKNATVIIEDGEVLSEEKILQEAANG